MVFSRSTPSSGLERTGTSGRTPFSPSITRAIDACASTTGDPAANAAKTLGRDVLVATVDLGEDSAAAVANGKIYSIGAQRPFMQGHGRSQGRRCRSARQGGSAVAALQADIDAKRKEAA